LIKKEPNEGNFVTEMKEGETLQTNGPAKFTIVQNNVNNNTRRTLVSVRADKSTKIKKLVEGALETAKKWDLA
jgi:hypothetical protein